MSIFRTPNRRFSLRFHVSDSGYLGCKSSKAPWGCTGFIIHLGLVLRADLEAFLRSHPPTSINHRCSLALGNFFPTFSQLSGARRVAILLKSCLARLPGGCGTGLSQLPTAWRSDTRTLHPPDTAVAPYCSSGSPVAALVGAWSFAKPMVCVGGEGRSRSRQDIPWVMARNLRPDISISGIRHRWFLNFSTSLPL